jgi:acyl carrier protein
MCELDLSLEEYFAVVAEIEDRYDVEIDDLVAVDCATLGGLIDRLRDQVAHPPRSERWHA